MLIVEILNFLIEGLSLIWNGSRATEWWHIWFAIGAGIIGGLVIYVCAEHIWFYARRKFHIFTTVLEMKGWKKTLLLSIDVWIIIEIAYYLWQTANWLPRNIFLAILMGFAGVIIALITYSLPWLTKDKKEISVIKELTT